MGYGLLQLKPDELWNMEWRDFLEMIQGRLWWLAVKNGYKPTRKYTKEEIENAKQELKELANKWQSVDRDLGSTSQMNRSNIQ